MGKPSAPKPPDPQETASASSSTNVATAIANAMLGNPSEVTPYGRTRVRKDGEYTWKDPYTKDKYTIPLLKRVTKLSPIQRDILKQQNQTSLNLSELANSQSDFLKGYMDKPYSYDVGQHEAWAGDLYDKLNDDKISQSDEALRTRLASQGIKAGTEAYDREMRNFDAGNQDARNKFMLDSYQTGQQTALTNRNQPINEIIGLTSGSQIQQPGFQGANTPTIPTTDVAGLINTNYDQRLNRYQLQQQQRNSMLGGLFGLGSSLIMASDERVKEDIEPVGKVDGHNVYSYEYRGKFDDGKRHVGVLAQEVERTRPDAVRTGEDGVKRVHYGKLFGIPRKAA